jgi:hypothetical protein
MLAVRKLARGIGNIEVQEVPEPSAGPGHRAGCRDIFGLSLLVPSTTSLARGDRKSFPTHYLPSFYRFEFRRLGMVSKGSCAFL